MATVSKEIADRVIAGYYAEDDPELETVLIVEYTNAFGTGQSFGLVTRWELAHAYSQELGQYTASEFVINPKVYWRKP